MLTTIISNVLIPERIGSYVVLPHTVVGIDIGKSEIHATKIYYKGTASNIMQSVHHLISTDAAIPLAQRITDCLKAVLYDIGPYDSIRSALPQSEAIVKQLTLPFIENTKIQRILPFEMERSLPFTLDTALIDFIVLSQSIEKQETTVLAAAVKKETVEQHLDYFRPLGVMPYALSLKSFDLYSLYKQTPGYTDSTATTVLMSIDMHGTHLAYLPGGQLSLLRTLPDGLSSWAKQVAQHTNKKSSDVLETLLRLGCSNEQDPTYTTKLNECLTEFVRKVQFTLDSFSTQDQAGAITSVILFGKGAEITGLTEWLSHHLAIPTVPYAISELLQNTTITAKNNHAITQEDIQSLSTALLTPMTERFNINSEQSSVIDQALFNRQCITGGTLLLLFFGFLLGYSYYNVHALTTMRKTAEEDMVRYIKTVGLSSARSVPQALIDAEDAVTEAENIWFSFSSQTRFSFLKYLQEISTAIDREGVGLQLTKLTIGKQDKQMIMQLDGEVKNFQALKTFERELRESNMFDAIPTLQTTKFSTRLALKKNGEEQP